MNQQVDQVYSLYGMIMMFQHRFPNRVNGHIVHRKCLSIGFIIVVMKQKRLERLIENRRWWFITGSSVYFNFSIKLAQLTEFHMFSGNIPVQLPKNYILFHIYSFKTAQVDSVYYVVEIVPFCEYIMRNNTIIELFSILKSINSKKFNFSKVPLITYSLICILFVSSYYVTYFPSLESR